MTQDADIEAMRAGDPLHTAKLRRVRLWLAIAAVGLTIFLVLVVFVQRNAPELIDAVDEGTMFSGLFLELVGTILVAGPLAGLFRAVFALGADTGTQDARGVVTLRLRDGARRLQIAMCFALFCLFMAGAILLRDDTLTLRIASLLGATFAGISGFIIHTAKIEYDATLLRDYRFLRRRRALNWDDLLDVVWVEALDHYRLDFTKGRKATISTSYAGHQALIALAERMSAANARTSRGGNRQTRPVACA